LFEDENEQEILYIQQRASIVVRGVELKLLLKGSKYVRIFPILLLVAVGCGTFLGGIIAPIEKKNLW
jgi:hypothetical protein